MGTKKVKVSETDQVEIRAALANALRSDRNSLAAALKVGASESAAFYTRTTIRQTKLLELLSIADEITLTIPDSWSE
jgi:hypothetical protein